jgi:hypothetical protein
MFVDQESKLEEGHGKIKQFLDVFKQVQPPTIWVTNPLHLPMQSAKHEHVQVPTWASSSFEIWLLSLMMAHGHRTASVSSYVLNIIDLLDAECLQWQPK